MVEKRSLTILFNRIWRTKKGTCLQTLKKSLPQIISMGIYHQLQLWFFLDIQSIHI